MNRHPPPILQILKYRGGGGIAGIGRSRAPGVEASVIVAGSNPLVVVPRSGADRPMDGPWDRHDQWNPRDPWNPFGHVHPVEVPVRRAIVCLISFGAIDGMVPRHFTGDGGLAGISRPRSHDAAICVGWVPSRLMRVRVGSRRIGSRQFGVRRGETIRDDAGRSEARRDDSRRRRAKRGEARRGETRRDEVRRREVDIGSQR